MKKSIALIGLVTVFFACKPEQNMPEEKKEGAYGNITVNVLSPNGSSFADAFTISGFEALPGSDISYTEGKAVISFKAAENQAVKQTTLNLTVKSETLLNDKGFSVSVPNIPAGEHSELVAEVAVGESADNYAFDVVSETAGEDEIRYSFGYLANIYYPSRIYHAEGLDTEFNVKFSIDSWYVNDSEYTLTGRVNADGFRGIRGGKGEIVKRIAGFESCTEEFLRGVEEEVGGFTSETYDFRVPAWSMWNVVQVNRSIPQYQTLFAYPLANGVPDKEHGIKIAIGTKYAEDFHCQAYDVPNPNWPERYDQGFGEGESNAGGSLSFNE